MMLSSSVLHTLCNSAFNFFNFASVIYPSNTDFWTCWRYFLHGNFLKYMLHIHSEKVKCSMIWFVAQPVDNASDKRGKLMREKRGIFYITRILSKLSIIIPIMLAFSLYYDSKILYIEELDYMRSPYKTFGMFIAFNLIWQASGARTYFKGIYETCRQKHFCCFILRNAILKSQCWSQYYPFLFFS
mgnify:CR=1 FL=1